MLAEEEQFVLEKAELLNILALIALNIVFLPGIRVHEAVASQEVEQSLVQPVMTGLPH